MTFMPSTFNAKKHIICFLVCLAFISPGCDKTESQKRETVYLQNDGYVEQGNRAFISAPNTGGEVAVTLGPVSNAFQITFITFLFGGTGQTVVNRNVILKIYKDYGSSNPGALLYTGNYTLSSSNSLLNQIDIRHEDITCPDGGSVRIAFEFVDNAGFPSFAQEFDGLYLPDKNWIKDSGGVWITDDMTGMHGNWVIRAVVERNI
jgi:hypothetical protein